MKKKLVAAAVLTALALPVSNANAVEVVGKKLNIYGKIHLSIDNSDRDVVGVSNDGLSISSNSSRLGFKGKVPLDDSLSIVYKIEQEVNFTDGGGAFATRNTYAGLSGDWGTLIAGIHDTPFKTVASRWGVFGDSVGERRAILGAGYLAHNQLNERVKNMIMYSRKAGALKFQLMYAVDPEDTVSGKVDDNDIYMTGLGLFYKQGNLWLAAGYEDWTGHSKIVNGNALRLAVKYKFGNARVGLIYESIDSDTIAEWKRDAFGANVVFKVGKGADVRLQYLSVDDADGTTDTGATRISAGYFKKLNKKTQWYVAYGATDNDANATFQGVDGGHGDEVATAAGGNPSALSLGLIFKF